MTPEKGDTPVSGEAIADNLNTIETDAMNEDLDADTLLDSIMSELRRDVNSPFASKEAVGEAARVERAGDGSDADGADAGLGEDERASNFTPITPPVSPAATGNAFKPVDGRDDSGSFAGFDTMSDEGEILTPIPVPEREYDVDFLNPKATTREFKLDRFRAHPSRMATAFPFLLQMLLGVVLAGGMLYGWYLSHPESPTVPTQSHYWMAALIGIAVLVVLGIVFIFVSWGVANRQCGKRPGRFVWSFFKGLISTAFCVALWIVVCVLCDSAGFGISLSL